MPRDYTYITESAQEGKKWERGSVAETWARLREPDQIGPYLRIAASIGLKLETQPFGPEHEDWRRPLYVARRTDVAYARARIAEHVWTHNVMLSAHVLAADLWPVAPLLRTKVDINTEYDAKFYDPDVGINANDDAGEVWDHIDTDEITTFFTSSTKAGSTPHAQKTRIMLNWFIEQDDA